MLVDNTIKTARRIMNGLRPQMLELMGFVDSAKIYCQEFEDRYKIKCFFESNIESLILQPQQTVALYRLLQESLSNIAKHSMATKTTISLKLKDSVLFLKIKDNGVGFSKDIKTKTDSYGMLGMKERALLLGGQVSIETQLRSGTEVCFSMTYNPSDKSV